MTVPTARTDGRCWYGDGRYASAIDTSLLTDIEHSRLMERVGVPRACSAHREIVEAELAKHAQNYRAREAGTA